MNAETARLVLHNRILSAIWELAQMERAAGEVQMANRVEAIHTAVALALDGARAAASPPQTPAHG